MNTTIEDKKIPARPKRNAEWVCRLAAEKMAPEILKWAGDDASELAKIIKDFTQLFEWNSTDDGYQLAKELESSPYYYDSDRELVEILDGASEAMRNAFRQACRDWVKAYRPPPPALESWVIWIGREDHGQGQVVRNEDDGTSLVCFPQKGHVREGMGTLGNIVEWEKLKAV